jgi:hypothetical protein
MSSEHPVDELGNVILQTNPKAKKLEIKFSIQQFQPRYRVAGQ